MKFTIVAAAAATLLGTVAVAQSADPMAGVPKADQAHVTKCKAMKHDAMMKSAMCMKMMKLYPDAFAGTASTNS